MPSYTLKYFNVRALGEVSRLLFAISGTEYKDERYPIDFNDSGVVRKEWDDMKHDTSKFPFGKIPVLIVDDKHLIAQSPAIQRYLAKQFKLMGSNDIEAAQIESVGEELIDIRAAFNKESDDGKVNFLNTKYAEYLTRLEEFAKKYGGAQGIVGNKMSLADVLLYFHDQYWNYNPAHREAVDAVISKSAPTVKQIISSVANNEKVKAWVAKRPQTKY